jgi:hypothetical protein
MGMTAAATLKTGMRSIAKSSCMAEKWKSNEEVLTQW